MNELLKELYDNFYIQPEPTTLREEIETCHQALIERLDKPERKPMLQIIGNKEYIAEDLSGEISATALSWRGSWQPNEINTKTDFIPGRRTGDGVRFLYQDKDRFPAQRCIT